MSELRISYEPDEHWSGEMTVQVVSGAFSGATTVWIDIASLGEFASALDRYPISPDEPACMEVTYGATLDGRRPAETRVRLSVTPVGRRGELLVQAELRAEVWSTSAADVRQSVVACFTTEYGLVDRFARSLKAVASGQSGQAILEGLPTSPA